MTVSICPAQSSLQNLAYGELSEMESESIFHHLRDCRDCQTHMESLTSDPSDFVLRQLRVKSDLAQYINEPDCRWAEAKALGAISDPFPEDRIDDMVSLPKELGDYQLIEPIASGGMGTVYKAHHQRLMRDVAVKIISSQRVTDLRAMQRFEAEIRTLGRLSHPNIVTALDAREVDGRPVLVMEYVDGLDLSQIVAKLGGLDPANVAAVGKAVAEALDYANANGLTHRDVKPSNIMINVLGEVKLLDLGLARLKLSDQTKPEWTGTGLVLGTADYMSPEQINDSRQVDIRSDLYSLGCTLYKLLIGQAPYSGSKYQSNFSKLAAHASAEPIRFGKDTTHIPEAMKLLVERLLEKSPSKRPSSALEISKLLEPFARTANLQQVVSIARTSPTLNRTSSHADFSGDRKGNRYSTWILPLVCCALFPVGIWFGTIISIKQKNGKITKIEVPDGATVQILEDGSLATQVRPATASNGTNLKPSMRIPSGTGGMTSMPPSDEEKMTTSPSPESGQDAMSQSNLNIVAGAPGGAVASMPSLPQQGKDASGILQDNDISSAMDSAGKSSVPTYRGYGFDKWLNLLQNERSGELIIESGKAVLSLADTPERITMATNEIMKRCRAIGGMTIDTQPTGELSHRWMGMLVEEFKSLDQDEVLPLLIDEMKKGNNNSRSAVALIIQISFMNDASLQIKDKPKLKYEDAKQLVEGLSVAAQASPKQSERFQNLALDWSYDYDLKWSDISEPIQEKSKKSWFNALNNGQRRQPNSDELRNVIQPQLWLPYWCSLTVGEKKPSFVIDSLFFDAAIRRNETYVNKILDEITIVSPEEMQEIKLVMIKHLAIADVEWATDIPDLWWSKLSSKFAKDEKVAGAIMQQVSRIAKEIDTNVYFSNGARPVADSARMQVATLLEDIVGRVSKLLEFQIPNDFELEYRLQSTPLQSPRWGGGGMGGMGGGMGGGMF